VFDPSFSLSIAATTGLLAFGQGLHRAQLAQPSQWAEPRRPELGRTLTAVSSAALTTLAATLPCLPILLSISPGLSLASIAANLLAAPVGEAVALPLCLAHALCAPFPALERGLALVASGALALIRSVALAAASVEWLYFEVPPPTPWQLAALVAGSAAFAAAGGRRWLDAGLSVPRPAPPSTAARTARAAVATLLSLLALEAVVRWQHSGAGIRLRHRLRVTALDVGQGDATLVDLPDGRLMLIDGGGFVGIPIDPGERVILPTLRARRRDRIDILVLTHPHPDHYGGLASVVRQVSVGEFWYGGADAAPSSPATSHADAASEPSSPATSHADAADAAAADAPLASGAASSQRELLELLRQRHVPTRSAAELCAAEGRIDDAIRLLHPCPTASVAPSANDASLVLRVSHGRHAALFVGDAERWAEQRLLATRAEALDADFLKVGHHGSRSSSSPEFLARVSPSVATISSGVRNRFGHPHPEALAHLGAAGASVFRLDQTGAVSWQSDGQVSSIDTFAGARAPP
jgi:competence protein ComEC